MKKFLYLIFCISVSLQLVSCSPSTDSLFDENAYEDVPDDITTDKDVLSFTVGGGSQTVTMTNYKYWWILDAYEERVWVYDHFEWTNVVYPTSSDPEKELSDLLDGGWYHAVVPNGGYSNEMIVTVDANTTGMARKATIDMLAGDANGSVDIWQDK